MTLLGARTLGAFLGVVGGTHFLLPSYYMRLVPPWLPCPRALVLASGVAEIGIGAGLELNETRSAAGWAAVALMAVYVLTHVDALLRASNDREDVLERPAGAVGRVVVNVGYLAWALAVATDASRSRR